MMKRNLFRTAAVVMAALMIQLAMAGSSFAYFNRGTVALTLGQSSVSLAAGSTVSVSVSIDPIKEDQLPGCGMAECPQSCGNSGCLNENGECTCGGTTYKTYYSSVSVSSSDSSVATASYASGKITIKGVSAGTAVITATGSMRQYTDATQTVSVRVSGGQTAAPAAGVKKSAAEEPAGGIAVTSVEKPAAKTDDTAAADQDGPLGKLQDTEKGRYRIVSLADDTDIAACFAQAEQEKSHLVFQKKAGDNVLWSWTFDASAVAAGTDVSALRLGISGSDTVPDSLSDQLRGHNVYYLDFDYDGQLPATAGIYINVSSVFAEDGDLYLYHVDSTTGKIEQADSDATAANGYATFDIDHCSDYFLTDEKIDTDAQQSSSDTAAGSSVNTAAVAAAIAVVAAAAAVITVIVKKKKRQHDD